MIRKKTKSKAKRLSEKVKPNDQNNQAIEENVQDKPFDFGGLPDRDLKKNLGCG